MAVNYVLVSMITFSIVALSAIIVLSTLPSFGYDYNLENIYWLVVEERVLSVDDALQNNALQKSLQTTENESNKSNMRQLDTINKITHRQFFDWIENDIVIGRRLSKVGFSLGVVDLFFRMLALSSLSCLKIETGKKGILGLWIAILILCLAHFLQNGYKSIIHFNNFFFN